MVRSASEASGTMWQWLKPAVRIVPVAIGWAIWLFYQHVCSPLLNGLFFPWTYKIPWIFGWGTPHGFAWWFIFIAVRAFSGWVVARLSRDHAAETVVVFAVSVLLWKAQVLPWMLHLLRADGDARYRLEFVSELMGIIVPFASILLGGLYARTMRREVSETRKPAPALP